MSRTAFRAKLRFLKTDEGGRKDFALSGYASAITFEANEKNQHAAHFTFENRDRVLPGEECEAIVTVISPELIRSKLNANASFEVREGFRLVGTGTILELL
jgi:elongation factor Tu